MFTIVVWSKFAKKNK